MDGVCRIRRQQPAVEIDERAAILLHCEQRHVMGGSIVKSYPRLRGAYRIGKRTAAGHDDDLTGTSRERLDPIAQMFGEGETAAELDDDRTIAAAHLGGHFRIGFSGHGIKVMNLGYLFGPATYDLHAGSAGTDFELFARPSRQ